MENNEVAEGDFIECLPPATEFDWVNLSHIQRDVVRKGLMALPAFSTNEDMERVFRNMDVVKHYVDRFPRPSNLTGRLDGFINTLFDRKNGGRRADTDQKYENVLAIALEGLKSKYSNDEFPELQKNPDVELL